MEPDNSAGVPAAADEALIGAEARQALGAALRDLPPEQAEVIDATYFRERSLGEVAADKRVREKHLQRTCVSCLSAAP